MATKAHSRTNSQVYADENTHHALTQHAMGGVHKAGAPAFGQDAKRGKTNILPAARTTLGDISNANRGVVNHDAAAKKPSAVSFPSVHRAVVEQPAAIVASQQHMLQQQHIQQQASSTVDPMDTTLEDIADLNINAAAPVSSAASSFAPSSTVAPILSNPIDEADKLNAQMCSEYGAEIQAYWRASELRRAPSATYMARQTDINPKMREILVDWMVEVQLKFKLKEETLFLAIHFLDRFLERRLVTRTKLQLVGCTALLLAAKYEEIYAPEVNDFVAISDKAYTREQIIAMEGIMLTALNFNLTVPTPINFLQRYSRLCGLEDKDQVWTLSLYFMELTLQSYTFLHFAPSAIAASALYLAMATAQQAMGLGHAPVWTAQQQALMEYTPAQVASCVAEMYKLVELNQSGLAKYKAVKKKFSLEKFHQVAKYTCRPPAL